MPLGTRRRRAIWPRSFTGQMLLALALALLLAQGISTALLYRVGIERMRETLIHSAAFRVLVATRQVADSANGKPDEPPPAANALEPKPLRAEVAAEFHIGPHDQRWADAEGELRHILADQDLKPANLLFVERPVAEDPVSLARVRRHAALVASARLDPASDGMDDPADHHRGAREPDKVLMIATQRLPNGPWLIVRVLMPPMGAARHVLAPLLVQTVLIYVLLVGAMAVILRHITRPLAALTRRLEVFARMRTPGAPLAPAGPDDLRRLIEAHNAMEARIGALLNEKDVMLGAIGHDLKTPLTALRVRIESVEDAEERARMAATIEDIVRSLDDILSLARVGRPSDPLESTELSALVASVVEEFEDMGEAVELGETERIAMPLRTTWLRRALRNLISNAVRYGGVARVSLGREGAPPGYSGAGHSGPGHNGPAWAAIRIEDDGPGIADGDIARMLEPFTRGEPSRSSGTGGAGLGLTLASAIAEQHGGTLSLANRHDAAGAVVGLVALLRLPLG
jgi:signal transduction histidine kinase